MKHSDFGIGNKFICGESTWLCTDVGTRIITAIELDPDKPGWEAGPPYAVAEIVFDEYDFAACEAP